MDIRQFEDRKRDHIRHALDPAHQAGGLSGLDRIQLRHEALPDLDFNQIQMASSCLGKPSRTPFYIAGMTAGHPDAPELNRRLAQASQRRGWAMGVGSQRRDLEASSRSPDDWISIRESVPELSLFANLGISQLQNASISAIQSLVKSIGAQAIVIHTNPLQECLQPEGTPSFRDSLDALKRLVDQIDLPVVLKETGCGFSKATLERVKEIGLAAIDVSGLGGTHWGRIEGARAKEGLRGALQAQASETFAAWGMSTAESVLAAREVLSGTATEIWGSGGVRSGLDAARLIALGAHRVGYAQPALKAALEGPEALDAWMERQEFELKVALFCTGCTEPAQLREREGMWKIIGD